jgi:hypothetical protein
MGFTKMGAPARTVKRRNETYFNMCGALVLGIFKQLIFTRCRQKKPTQIREFSFWRLQFILDA